MKKQRAFVAVTALLTLACGASGAFNHLPAYQKDAWMRCSQVISPVVCPGTHDMSQGVCLNGQADDWAKLPSDADRRTWLIGHGCTAEMVDASVVHR